MRKINLRIFCSKGICRFFLVPVVVFFTFFSVNFHSGSIPVGDDRVFPLSIAQPVWGKAPFELPLWPHEQSDLKPNPKAVWGRLPNGFRYVLLHNSEPRDRVSMHLNVQAGSVHEADGKEGTAHFLEHMVFAGTEHFKAGQLINFFQSIGMKFGPDVNGHTGYYNTVYDILLPDGKKETLEQGLLVFQDYAGGALLVPQEIERERKVVLSEMRTRDNPDFRTFVETLKFELPGTLISRRLPAGLQESLALVGKKVLKDYYDTWYRPDRMILIMVGDFEVSVAEKLIRQSFKEMKSRSSVNAEPNIGSVVHRGIRPFYHFEESSGAARVTLETVRQVRPELDSLEFQKRMILRSLAHEILQNRLDERVRKPGSPFSSAYAGASIFFRQLQYTEVSAQCSPEKWKQTLEAIVEILEGALKYGFETSEVERVKKDFLRDLETAVMEADTVNSQDLSRRILSSLNSHKVFQSPHQRKAMFEAYVESVGREGLQKALLDAWTKDHRLVMVTGNARIDETEMPPQERIRMVYEGSLEQPLAEMCRPLTASVFPYLPEPVGRGAVIKRSSFDDLDITLVEFENGIRLNLKKTDFTANEIQVNIAFGRGRSSEPGHKPGLAELTQAVVNESGLGRCHQTDLEKALSGREIDLKFNVLEDRFEFRSRCSAEETPLLFKLLYTYIMDPAYRDDACGLCMERFIQEYRSMGKTVEGAWQIHGGRFLSGGDSRFGFPNIQEFSRLTIDDVRQWMGPVFGNAPLEISVVGDFDSTQVVDLVGRYFGTLPERNSEPPSAADSGPVFPEGKAFHYTVDTDILKTIVAVAYPTDDFWNIRQTRRLSVLAEVFSQRLRVMIREKLGAAYSPYAVSLPSRAYPGYGMIRAAVSCHPDKVDLVVAEVRKIATDLSNNTISPEELQRALTPILTQIKALRRVNGYWLDSVMTGYSRHPEQLDWARSIASDYASITVGDIHRMARLFLGNDRAATVFVHPAVESN